MGQEIKVSVVVPVYNAQAFLEQCLDSILGQTLEEIEIICVDDGSADESGDILEEYRKRDSRVAVYHQKNQYAGVARNLGLRYAKGKYVIFWDSDDFFEKEALELLYKKAEEDQADICICGARKYNQETGMVYPAGEYLVKKRIPAQMPFNKNDMGKYLFNFCSNVPWNKLFLRRFVQEHELEFQPLRQANDVYFTMMALFMAKRMTVVPEELICYRTLNSDSLSGRVSDTKYCTVDAFRAAKKKLESFPEFTDEFRQSFANKTIGPLLITLRRQGDIKGYAELYSYYKETVLKEFNLWGQREDFFNSQQDYEDLRRMQECDYQEFLLYQAQSYEKRLKQERGKFRAMERKQKEKGKKDKKQEEKLKKRIEELENSTSYRLGRVVTYVPGMMKRLVKKPTAGTSSKERGE